MSRTVDPDRARRIAVRAQLLDGSATSVLDTVRRLGFLQIDPIATVATPQELVLWSRLGAFDRGELDRLLWAEGQLFEWNALIWPIESLPMVRAWMRAYRRANTTARERWWRQFLEQNQGFRRYVLRELERRGPLLSRDLDDRSVERGQRHRWHGSRHVGRMLEILQLRGEIGIVGRSGGQRLWDVADRWQPPDDHPLTRREADRLFAEQRFRALGVRLVKGEWRAHPGIADDPVGDRVTVLSPFDRLIHDRSRAEALFGFRYRLEMYVPPAKREYGYYVLPVLRGDRIVGRIEPRFDRLTGDMHVLGRWGDTAGVDPVLERLRGFLRTTARSPGDVGDALQGRPMQIDLGTLVVIVALAAAAPLIVDVVPRIVLPVVVVEILLGIVVGPPILGWIHVTGLAQVLADFGLAFLFFLAGFELDLDQLRGMPARLALTGWGVSVAVALVVAGLLEALDVVESTLFVGVALTTTALGTLAPILRDNGDAEGRFGALVSAAGACGEVGPIILISLLLSETSNRGISALLLVVFGLVTGAVAFAAPRLKPVRVLQVLEETLERTGQFAVRLALLILVSLVYLTSRLHLDLVLGAFAAGLVGSIACGPRAKRLMQPRLDAVGFGVFIPIFFIVTGMQFDLNAITSSVSGMLKLPLFVAMFLVVRGLPTLFIYRYALGTRDRVALGLYASTALPLVVAVTSLGVKDGQMRASTAAGLVGAAMVSVMVFPLSANAIRRRGAPRTMRRS